MTTPRNPKTSEKTFPEKARDSLVGTYALLFQTPIGQKHSNGVAGIVEGIGLNTVLFPITKVLDQYRLNPNLSFRAAIGTAIKHPLLGFSSEIAKGGAYLGIVNFTQPVFLDLIKTFSSVNNSQDTASRSVFMSNAFAATFARGCISPLSVLSTQINYQLSDGISKKQIYKNLSELPVSALVKGSLPMMFRDALTYSSYVALQNKFEPHMPGSPEAKAGTAGTLAMITLSPLTSLVSLAIEIGRSRNVSFSTAFTILCTQYTPRKVVNCTLPTFFTSALLGGILAVERKLTQEAKEKAQENLKTKNCP